MKELNEAAKARDLPIKERNAPHEEAHREARKVYDEARKAYEAAKKAQESGGAAPEAPKEPAPPRLEPRIFHLEEVDEGLLTKLSFCARGKYVVPSSSLSPPKLVLIFIYLASTPSQPSLEA